MNDEVRNAAFIAAAINKGLGGIPTPKKKKKDNKKDDKKKTSETTESTATKENKETKALPKNPSSKNSETTDAPVFVKSERINTPSESSGPKPITFTPKTLPTHGPGSEYNPNRGRQFNG
jgi:hypothetical protein